MNYSSLEADIVGRIAAKITAGASIMPIPEADPDVIFPSSGGQITVAYNGSKYDLPDTTYFIAQPETISFEIIIRSRKLRGTTGIYTLLSGIKTALLGWKTPVSEKIQFSKANYVAHDNGVWTYALTLTTVALSIEEPDDGETVIATKLTAATTNYENITVESETPTET